MYSIIIPVYNTSKYLRQCLDLVLCQKVEDYEVILVNDGSTDNSLEICQEYARKDSRFFIIDQINKGRFFARRIGIQKAKGQYLLFIDSDDFWESNTLEVLDNTIRYYNFSDIIVFNFNRVDESGRFIAKLTRDLPYEKIFNRDEYYKNIYELLVTSDHLNSLCSMVVKHEIVDMNGNDDDYGKVLLGEDLLQSLQFILKSKNILFIDSYIYNYRNNPKSITNNFTLKSFENNLFVGRAVITILSKEADFPNSLFDLFRNRKIELLLKTINLISVSKRKYKEKRNMILTIYQESSIRETRLHFKHKRYAKHNVLTKFMFSLLDKKITLIIVLMLNYRYKLLKNG